MIAASQRLRFISTKSPSGRSRNGFYRFSAKRYDRVNQIIHLVLALIIERESWLTQLSIPRIARPEPWRKWNRSLSVRLSEVCAHFGTPEVPVLFPEIHVGFRVIWVVLDHIKVQISSHAGRSRDLKIAVLEFWI